MIFGSAVWLWLGLGILVPLFIHLWNKKVRKPRLLGTYRFLPEESRASASRIELHEIPLLLIRMGIVVLIMLLMSELFWKKESESVNTISIQEVKDGERTEVNDASGIITIKIPTKEINIHGWWNILQQVEHDYFPENVSINGELSQNRFKGVRPTTGIAVDWNRIDSLGNQQKELAKWIGVDGKTKALSQLRTEDGIITKIIDLDEKEAQSVESITLILNPKNKESINTGLKYAAEVLKIPVEEREIPNIAAVQVGDSMFNLVQNISKNDVQELAEPNSWTGVSFNISGLDTQQVFVESLINTEPGETFLGLNAAGEFVINGQVEPNLESWVYAGIGNALILNSLDIGEPLYPNMEEGQLMLNESNSSIRSSSKPHSAKNWIFGLLLLFWLVERIVAPRRGM